MPIPVYRVVPVSLPVTQSYIGTTEPIRNVTIEVQAPGNLKRQLVPDGSDIRKGNLVYQIDPRYYKAELDQSQAQKEKDKAALEYFRVNQRRNSLLVLHWDVS